MPINGKDRASLERLAALTVLTGVLAVLSLPDARSAGSECTPEDRAGQLTQAQQGVLGMLGTLTTLNNEVDLAALAGLGYDFYDHQQVSFKGMGWPVVNPDGNSANRPFVLLYAPTPPEPPATVTHPRDGFDFPYTLAGWAYSPPDRYNFESPPTIPDLECIGREEWFVHERGIHPFETGGMTPLPPPEELDGDTPHGTSYGQDIRPLLTQMAPGDFPHPRIWDLHVWLDGDNVPTVSMLNPGDPIPGINPDNGVSPPPDGDYPAFYYPLRVADLSVQQVDQPDPARLGQELTYIITVGNSGPDRATGVTLTVELSKHADGSASPSHGSCTKTKTTVTCQLGSLATDVLSTVELVLRPTTKGTLTSIASVTGNEKDLKGTIDPRDPTDPLDDIQLWKDATADNTHSETTTVPA
ncbi:MAG: DUF11 domain-containing protein [Actinomycetota bacterium]|nr:DUF11 domain-containing protein [Actinomycetota bacterium]